MIIFITMLAIATIIITTVVLFNIMAERASIADQKLFEKEIAHLSEKQQEDLLTEYLLHEAEKDLH